MTENTAADRVAAYLNARTYADTTISSARTKVSERSGRINYELHDLTVVDVQAVLDELAEYKAAVAAVFALPEHRAGTVPYNHGHAHGVRDVQVTLASNITDLEV